MLLFEPLLYLRHKENIGDQILEGALSEKKMYNLVKEYSHISRKLKYFMVNSVIAVLYNLFKDNLPKILGRVA